MGGDGACRYPITQTTGGLSLCLPSPVATRPRSSVRHKRSSTLGQADRRPIRMRECVFAVAAVLGENKARA